MAAFSFFLISLLEFLIFVLGTSGNFITCCVVFKNKQLQNSAYFYVVSLAAADLITCAVLVPTRSLQHLGVFIDNTSLSQFGLDFIPVIGRVTLLASFINLAVLSIDRLIAVSFPFFYRLNLRNSKKTVPIVILGVWLLVIILTSLPEFQSIDQRVGHILFVTCIIPTTLIILGSNARVLFIVRRQSRFRRQLMPSSEAVQTRKVSGNFGKRVDKDECATSKGQENKPTSSLNITSCHRPVSAVLTRYHTSNPLHETRKYTSTLMQVGNNKKAQQPPKGSSQNSPLKKRKCNEEKSDDTRVKRRHSWPDSFSKSNYYDSDKIIPDKGNVFLSKEVSNTDIEMSGIVKELPSRQPHANQNSHNDSTSITANIRRTGNKEEKKTAVSVAIVILVFIILVYPRVSLIFYHFFYPETFDSVVVRLWLRVLMYANSAINPVLYAWRMPRLRDAFKNMIRCKK